MQKAHKSFYPNKKFFINAIAFVSQFDYKTVAQTTVENMIALLQDYAPQSKEA